MGSFENNTSVATEEHIPTPTPDEASFVIAAMQRLTDEYGRRLMNGTAAAYKAGSLTTKSDIACVGWASNPETWHKSVELKGLHMSKLVLKAALDTDLDKPNNRYLPLVDYDYWHRVDIKVYSNISRYISEASLDSELLLQPSPEGELPSGVIARIQNNVIHRGASLRPDGQDNMVVYAVYPRDYPAKCAGPIIH